MTLSRWTRFGAFTHLEQELHTLLDHFGGRPWLEGFGWEPDTDMWRDGNALMIEVDLPGVDPAHDLDIIVSDGVLLIEGERTPSAEPNEKDRLVQERRCGSFHRTVMLPDGVVPASLEASFNNGTLTVRVPIPDSFTDVIAPYRIPVRTSDK